MTGDLDHTEPGVMEDLSELMKAVDPEGELLLDLSSGFEDQRAFYLEAARDEVEGALLHTHAAIALEPEHVRLVADDMVTVDRPDDEHSPALERSADSFDNVDVGLVVEEAKARANAAGAVKGRFKGDLTHISMDEVDLLVVLLGELRRPGEHGQGEVKPNDLIAPAREFHRVATVAAGEVEDHPAFLDPEG